MKPIISKQALIYLYEDFVIESKKESPCRIGARVRPRGYEARPLELSLGATTAFRETYRRARGEKALAISPSSGRFAIATGAGAAARATADCDRAAQGAGDCRVVIAD